MSEPGFLTVEHVEWLHQVAIDRLAGHMDPVIDSSTDLLRSRVLLSYIFSHVISKFGEGNRFAVLIDRLKQTRELTNEVVI
jgi:hypothetical protein